MTAHKWMLVVAVGLGAMGCVSSPAPTQPTAAKVARPSQQPPDYPKKLPAVVDAPLRESARSEISRALVDPDPLVRANAVEATQMSVGRDGGADILRALNDPHPIVRFAGAMAAGTLQMREAHPALLRMVEDSDQQVQIGVRYALHRLGDKHLSRDLEMFAGSTEPSLRANTVLALGLTGDKTALNILRQMANDIEPQVRVQVAEALWRLGDEKGLEMLAVGCISGFPDERIVSIQGLAGPRDKRVIQHIRANLVSPYEEVALVAARAMGQLGSDEGYGVARRGAKSKDPRQRSLAALAFGAISRADSQNTLGELLKDSERSVRLAAATAMLQLQDDAPSDVAQAAGSIQAAGAGKFQKGRQ